MAEEEHRDSWKEGQKESESHSVISDSVTH